MTYSATFAPPPNTLNPETTHYNHPPTAETRDIQFQRENYKKVAPDPNYWPKIYDRVGNIQWKGFSKEELASIKAPMLIVQGDHDFVRLEHSVETVKLIPHAELAVIPDAGHFALSSEQERVIPIIKHFLEKPEKRLPIATAEKGYHPGETRSNPIEGNHGNYHMRKSFLGRCAAASSRSNSSFPIRFQPFAAKA